MSEKKQENREEERWTTNMMSSDAEGRDSAHRSVRGSVGADMIVCVGGCVVVVKLMVVCRKMMVEWQNGISDL